MAVLILLKRWTTRGNHATSSATMHPFCNDSFLYHILCLCFCSGLFHYYSLYIKTQGVQTWMISVLMLIIVGVYFTRCLLRQAWNRKYLNCSKWINSIRYLNSIFKFIIQIHNHKWELFNILFGDGMESKWRLLRRFPASQMVLLRSQQSHMYLLLVSIRT